MLRFVFACSAIALSLCAPLAAGQLVINTTGGIAASGVAQPQLSALLYSGTPGNLATGPDGAPITFDPYIDTGASGFVISSITGTGCTISGIFGPEVVPGMGIGTTHGVITGTYTDYGIGGPEVGLVTSPLGMRIRNGSPLQATIDWDTGDVYPPVVVPGEFVDYGPYKLWMRQQPGYGEVMDLMGLQVLGEPMDVVGMPVIQNRILRMDPLSLATASEDVMPALTTELLPKGTPSGSHNVTFSLAMKDFVNSGTAQLSGTGVPDYAKNPTFQHVTIRNDSGQGVLSVTNQTWLFDTGSQSTMISFDAAKALGLVSGSSTFAELLAESPIKLAASGIGCITEPVYLPVLTIGEISIPDADGNDVIWRDVDVAVLNIAGLDGVFGLNLLLPATTFDIATLTEYNSSGGWFDNIAFEVLSADQGELRLLYNPNAVPEPATMALLLCGAAALLRRRRMASL